MAKKHTRFLRAIWFRVGAGTLFWVAGLFIVLVPLFAAGFDNVVGWLFAGAIVFALMVGDWCLHQRVARDFNPTLISLVDEIVSVFDEGGLDAWNDGARRGAYSGGLLALRYAARLALGCNAYASSARASIKAVANKLRAQGGDWAEVRSELLRLRECARRGEVGSPRCALVAEKEECSPWGWLRWALTLLVYLVSLVVRVAMRDVRWPEVKWP